MFKERLQEIFEFTKSESPYSKANKGWINQDIFLEFGESSSILSKQKEAAKVTLSWAPIQRLISNLLLLIVISSLLVLSTIKFSKLNFNLSSLTFALKSKLVQLDNNKSNLTIEEIEIIDNDLDPKIEKVFKEVPNQDKKVLVNEEDLLNSTKNITEDQISELNEEKLIDIELKNDFEISSNKKFKSNFF